MTRKQIIRDKDFRFSTQELVCPHIYERFGDVALQYFDIRLLETLLWIRKNIGLPMTVNTWSFGGNLSQRGLRCNMCEMVKGKTQAYLSSHILGQGIDFNVNGVDAADVRKWLDECQKQLPYPIRLERMHDGKEITWVHLDVRNETPYKIVYFND